MISSAGFWVQHATNEWLLTSAAATCAASSAPFVKGVFAFNVGASAMYSGAAFARIGPPERDTRGMADSARWRSVGLARSILAPALLDAWRYLDPESSWPVWLSRAAKVGGVLDCGARD